MNKSNILSILVSFLVGGTVTAVIVSFEQNGNRIISGVAALAPVFTVVSYLFIGASNDGAAVGQHSKFVLVGTLVSWIPYMAAVAYLAPRLGTNKAIGIGLAVFFLLASLYAGAVARFSWFR